MNIRGKAVCVGELPLRPGCGIVFVLVRFNHVERSIDAHHGAM
jgi:hypothetical protein